jgi:CheY-like chemotaxis protein
VDICIADIETTMISEFDLVKQVHKQAPPMSRIPLLAISSLILGHSGKYRDSGYDAFLQKPIRGKKLVPMVEQLLAELPNKEYKDLKKQENDVSSPLPVKLEPPGLPVIPGISQPVEIIPTPSSITAETRSPVHILLVEDNLINRKLASFILIKAGYSLSAVEDGEKAVEMFSAAPGKFDLVFMDIQMPRMNGLEATKAIRDKGFQDIPIIAMTAQSMKGDREKFLASGMNDYIAKPIKRESVFEIIKKWCPAK